MFSGYLFDKYRTYDLVFQFAAIVFLTNTIMFIITYMARTCRNLNGRQLPAHVRKLTPAPSYDEPFEEIDDIDAPLANDTRPKMPSTSADHSAKYPVPNIAP